VLQPEVDRSKDGHVPGLQGLGERLEHPRRS
jgi:hypothetical protein